jgi:hypothetical protein
VVKKAPDPGSETLKVRQSAVLYREITELRIRTHLYPDPEAEIAAYLLKKHLKSSWISYQFAKFYPDKIHRLRKKIKSNKFFGR